MSHETYKNKIEMKITYIAVRQLITLKDLSTDTRVESPRAAC